MSPFHKINTRAPSNLRYSMILFLPSTSVQVIQDKHGIKDENKQNICLLIAWLWWQKSSQTHCKVQGLQQGPSSVDLAFYGQHKGRVNIVWFYQIRPKTEEDAKVSVKLRCTYECFSLSIVDLKLPNQFLPVIWLISGNCFHMQVRILRG